MTNLRRSTPRQRRHKRVEGDDRRQSNSFALLKRVARERAKLTIEAFAELARDVTGDASYTSKWVGKQENPRFEPFAADLRVYDQVLGLPDAMFAFISLASANYRERKHKQKRDELVAMFEAVALMCNHVVDVETRSLRELNLRGDVGKQQEKLMRAWLGFCDQCGLRTVPRKD
jgi:hypothetical protein